MDDSDSDTEEWAARHRKEKKELQAKIQKIKRSTPKGNKKLQKEAREEIARLEEELKASHAKELEELKSQRASEAAADECTAQVETLTVGEAGDGDTVAEVAQPKQSKAAKRRVNNPVHHIFKSAADFLKEKKEREEKEREARIAQGLLDSVNHVRNIEQSLLTAKLSKLSLHVYDIPSDGDCLYKAIAHQMSLRTGQPAVSVKELRSKTADQMRQHPDSYMPYITTHDGSLLDQDGYNTYVDMVENSHEWGGHVEINAMSRALGYPILIIQADTADITIAPTESSLSPEPLRVVYHKHLYELGEHYNSVVEAKS